jgi:hypothetical protein
VPFDICIKKNRRRACSLFGGSVVAGSALPTISSRLLQVFKRIHYKANKKKASLQKYFEGMSLFNTFTD